MKKSELMELVGKEVDVTFTDGDRASGELGYVTCFSAKFGYRSPDYFYIGTTSFKVSHVKKCKAH